MKAPPSNLPDVYSAIDAIMSELEAAPDQALGGPSAPSARANARRVAEYLLSLGDEQLPRHAGKPSTGKIAKAIAASAPRFNRQIFFTNEWSARLLSAYDEWEQFAGVTRLAAAQAIVEEKEPTNRRISDLERELLLLRAENDRLRRELAFVRGFVAASGRLP